jgi:hypothetical protein
MATRQRRTSFRSRGSSGRKPPQQSEPPCRGRRGRPKPGADPVHWTVVTFHTSVYNAATRPVRTGRGRTPCPPDRPGATAKPWSGRCFHHECGNGVRSRSHGEAALSSGRMPASASGAKREPSGSVAERLVVQGESRLDRSRLPALEAPIVMTFSPTSYSRRPHRSSRSSSRGGRVPRQILSRPRRYRRGGLDRCRRTDPASRTSG